MTLRIIKIPQLCLVVIISCLPLLRYTNAREKVVSACEVVADPVSFDSKVTSVRGFVFLGFEEFELGSPSCSERINLEVDEQLRNSREFEAMMRRLESRDKVEVEVTMTGMVHGVLKSGVRTPAGTTGFGHLNQYRVQIWAHSMKDLKLRKLGVAHSELTVGEVKFGDRGVWNAPDRVSAASQR